MSYQDQGNTSFFRLDGWGLPIVGVLTMLLALVAIAATRAEATDKESCEGEACVEAADDHHGWGHHRRGHGFFGRRGHHDPEEAKEHMQYAAGWMMRKLDVEEPVREQIHARLETAFDDLHPIVEKHRESRGVWVEAMFGETVDREALEAQRKQAMESAEQAMQIFTDTMADVSEMLTPEQRAQITERIERHRHHRRHW